MHSPTRRNVHVKRRLSFLFTTFPPCLHYKPFFLSFCKSNVLSSDRFICSSALKHRYPPLVDIPGKTACTPLKHAYCMCSHFLGSDGFNNMSHTSSFLCVWPHLGPCLWMAEQLGFLPVFHAVPEQLMFSSLIYQAYVKAYRSCQLVEAGEFKGFYPLNGKEGSTNVCSLLYISVLIEWVSQPWLDKAESGYYGYYYTVCCLSTHSGCGFTIRVQHNTWNMEEMYLVILIAKPLTPLCWVLASGGGGFS